MNFYSILATILAVVVLIFGINGSGDLTAFLNIHALFIVIGGTFTASAISFQLDRLFVLFKIFIGTFFSKNKIDITVIIKEIVRMNQGYQGGSDALQTAVSQARDPFLKEAMILVQEGALSQEEIVDTLKGRVSAIYYKQSDEVSKLRTISRYPPAFGLLGTTLSMIRLLQRLGDAGAQKMIGTEMALGLIATFYGLVLANLVLYPMAENLSDNARRLRYKNLVIVEGVRMMLNGSGPIAIAEKLNSYLMVGDRLAWQQFVQPEMETGTSSESPGIAA